MASRPQVPKFGNWENKDDVPYTVYFEKAKRVREAKTKLHISDPSSTNEPPIQSGSTKSEPERPKASKTKEVNPANHEELDLKKSSDSLSSPRSRHTIRQSDGSDRSFDSSPMHPKFPARSGNKGSSEGIHGGASSTPGRSRLKQASRDETLDDGTPIPKFGGWDERDPASAEGYTHIFDKARADRHNGGGKSPMVTTENANFYGQNQNGNDRSKGCGCFPWSRK